MNLITRKKRVSDLLSNLFLVIIVQLISISHSFAQTDTKEKPNFIFILTDDHRYDLLGSSGNELIKTPHLDQLAQEGILFENAHVTSAICTPSRISILLSQFERKHSVNFNSGTSVSEEAWNESYPVVLKNNGYYTGYVGKNHAPIGDGGYQSGLMDTSFDYWYAGHGHLSFYPKDRHEIFAAAKQNTQIEIMGEGVSDFFSNEYKLEGAKYFLNQRPKEQPFCLSIAFNLPHGASTTTMKMLDTDPETYKSLYRDKEIPLPVDYIAKKDIKTPKLPPEVLHVSDRQNIYDFVDNKIDLKERIIRNMQAVTGIDMLIGNLRATLKQLNLDKNTIIIFTSDHGIFWGEDGLGGKALCYEVCTKVPMIIHNPMSSKKSKGIVNNELVQTIDIAPTMLQYAGINIPNSYQGKPLNNMIEGNNESIRDYLFTENLWSTHFGNPRCESVQNKQWKYIRYYKNENISSKNVMAIAKDHNINLTKLLYGNHDPQIAVYQTYIESSLNGEPAVYEELYHLKTDPKEKNNLINNLDYNKELKIMRLAWREKINYARGEGKAKILRYTIDSKAEKGNISMPE
jgi:arylsulfatase A-like enzyme